MGEYNWFQVSASVFAFVVLAPFLAVTMLMLLVSAPVLLSMLLPAVAVAASSGR